MSSSPPSKRSLTGDAAGSKLKLFNAWFCPFAQRAWIALLHKGVDFEYVETDPYAKGPDLLAVNPNGLVPAIDNGGEHVYESMICVEYIDELRPGSSNLLPESAHGRATARIWADYVNRKIVPEFYKLLQKRTQSERDEASRALLSALRCWCTAMEKLSAAGPFFAGSEFGLVDVALAPWVDRFYILKHHRGFEVPGSEEEDGAFARFHTWWQAVQAVPAFHDTVQDRERLLAKYQRYADDTATSLVAVAVREGNALP